MIKRNMIFAITAVIMLGGCAGESDDRSGQPLSSPIKVMVATVERVAETTHDEFMGNVIVRNRADLESKIQARVNRINVDLGSRVNEGDILAELDSREFEARVRQARALQEQASGDLTRFENLLSQQAVTQQEFDVVRTRKIVSDAGLTEAETALSYARVVAPFAGVIAGRMIDVGDLAVPGRPLFTIEEAAPLRFMAALPEARLGSLSMGDSITVMIPNLDLPVRGRIEEISPSASPVNRTFIVKIGLPAAAGIHPGQFGRLLLPTDGGATIFIPRSALVKRGQLDLVYVVTPDRKAMLRLVRVGRQFPDRLEILSGLRENEKVVISDQRDLRDGDPVEEISS